MVSSRCKALLVFAAAGALALSCAQSETLDIIQPGSTGGTTAAGTGGTTAAGGTTGTGGVSATGGTTGTGGSATGGTVGTGGGGGARATGGTTGSGGTPATGGTNGGAGHGGGAGASGATFADVTAMLAANCVGCHDGTAHTDLRATGLYGRIVNQSPTVSTNSSCTSQKLIVPNNPSSSLISNKIKGTNLNGCGARMPFGCSTTSTNPRACLTTTQISTVDSWINAGAPM